MSAKSDHDPGVPVLPDWALGQAMNDLNDGDSVGRDERARELVRDFEHERHDQDDDPDRGGEA
jgi:hypothetical protein